MRFFIKISIIFLPVLVAGWNRVMARPYTNPVFASVTIEIRSSGHWLSLGPNPEGDWMTFDESERDEESYEIYDLEHRARDSVAREIVVLIQLDNRTVTVLNENVVVDDEINDPEGRTEAEFIEDVVVLIPLSPRTDTALNENVVVDDEINDPEGRTEVELIEDVVLVIPLSPRTDTALNENVVVDDEINDPEGRRGGRPLPAIRISFAFPRL